VCWRCVGRFWTCLLVGVPAELVQIRKQDIQYAIIETQAKASTEKGGKERDDQR